VETELRYRYLGTARRKGRQQTTRTYDHRATSRLYQPVRPIECRKVADQRLTPLPEPVGQPKAAKVVGEGRLSTAGGDRQLMGIQNS
jgi:hypothetical protein